MNLRIFGFGRRREEVRKQAAEIKPGTLTDNNAVVMQMAAKYVRYMLAAGAAALVIAYLAMGQVDVGSKAYETFRSSYMVTIYGIITLGAIYLLFRAAEWTEAKAVRLDVRESDEEPTSREVRRYMARAIFMIQLGYRLVMFAGVCLVIGVVFVFKGYFET